ncbi:MAG TPA: hypothetical protein PKX23_14985 [Verrucomicrobiota bacterium]|nr:hypothetical protein [Verrucomicrobiota bacterium]
MNESNITSNGGAVAPVEVPVYCVANWDEKYETHQTGKLNERGWVRWPRQLDDLSYRRLAAHPRACEALAAWGVILQVASQGEGGWLMRRGEPLTAEDLAWVSGLPAAVFELALPLLASPAIGWLEVVVVVVAAAGASPAQGVSAAESGPKDRTESARPEGVDGPGAGRRGGAATQGGGVA